MDNCRITGHQPHRHAGVHSGGGTRDDRTQARPDHRHFIDPGTPRHARWRGLLGVEVGAAGADEIAALEVGEFGINVNAVIPGLIDTELTRNERRYTQALKEARR